MSREALSRAISPLSSYQRRVWRLIGTHAERALFERISVRIRGPLSCAVVASAVGDVSRRHGVLRAVFPVVNGRPVQCVRAQGARLLLVDLQGLPPRAREDVARGIARRSRQPRFDVARGPLIRATLLKLAVDDHVWLAFVHHLVFDGGSRQVLMRELQSWMMRPSSPFASAPQYADFARREQKPEAVQQRAARVAQWVERLATRQPPATLPSDRPRSAYKTRRGELLLFDVPPPTLHMLNELCRREAVSMFMLLIAALAIALRRESGQDEVTCGMPVANRTSVDTEAAIGPFINILIVRVLASAGMRVADLVAQTRATMLDAFADRGVPFDDILAGLHPTHPLDSYGPVGGPPLFRVCVSFEEAAAESQAPVVASQAGLTMAPFEPADAIAGCDATITLISGPRSLSGIVLYSAELFDRSTIARFVSSFLATLDDLQPAWNRTLADIAA